MVGYKLTDLESDVYEDGNTLRVELPLPTMKNGALFTLNKKNNTHFQVYKQIKNDYKNMVKSKLIYQGKQFTKLNIYYEFYLTEARNNKKPDLDNIASITKKFFNDSIKDIGLVADDNMDYIVKNVEEYKGIADTDKVEISMIQVGNRTVAIWEGEKPKLTKKNTYEFDGEIFFYCKKDFTQKPNKIFNIYRYSDGMLIHAAETLEECTGTIDKLWRGMKKKWNL